MAHRYPAQEGAMARTVLSVVAHHRMQGLIRENQALVEANRTLALRIAQANES